MSNRIHKRPCRRGTRGSVIAEMALILPVFTLLVVALLNFPLAAFVAHNAANAANYGARIGSVTQGNAAGAATAAAGQSAQQYVIGDYKVAAYGGGRPGAQIVVAVTWSYPNFLSAMIGGSPTFTGTVYSTFRQEGW
jgi:Flp pilus assembly protein TadG